MLFQNPTIPLDQLPKLEDNATEKPERALLKLSLIAAGIFCLILLAGAIVLGVVPIPIWVRLLAWSGILLIGIFVFLASYKGYECKAYGLREHDLTYRSGWLWHSVTTVPFTRVQHVEVQQGPLERALHLASLKVFTAGGSSSDLSVPGLRPEIARELKDYILQRVNRNES